MTAKDLINSSVIPLRAADAGTDALSLMDELRVSQLPVLNERDLAGLISDSDIYIREDPDLPVWDHKQNLNRVYVYESQHIYDVLRIFSEQKLTLLPVLNAKNHYSGSITLADVVSHLAAIASLDHPGGVIVLEVNEKDYLLTEIAGIVESNDAKILSLYITSFSGSTKLEITIKVNQNEIGAILQTFYRYNYTVSASWSKDDSTKEGLQERFDSLMNYLNI